jgi:hypothetical protein
MGRMAGVKLLLQSAMIFFGTLMAAGLVALGEPPDGPVQRTAAHQQPTLHALNRVVDSARLWVDGAAARHAR